MAFFMFAVSESYSIGVLIMSQYFSGRTSDFRFDLHQPWIFWTARHFALEPSELLQSQFCFPSIPNVAVHRTGHSYYSSDSLLDISLVSSKL